MSGSSHNLSRPCQFVVKRFDEIPENARPTRPRRFQPFGQDAFVGESEFARRARRDDVDCHAGDYRRIFWNAEGKHESPRPIDFQIFAYVFDVLTVATNEDESAANPCVDLGADHFAGIGGEQPTAGDFGVEPGVKNELRPGVKRALDN